MEELLEKLMGAVAVTALDGWLNQRGEFIPLKFSTHYLDACRMSGKKMSDVQYATWCDRKGLIRVLYGSSIDQLDIQVFGSEITIAQLAMIRKYAKDTESFYWETPQGYGKGFLKFRKHISDFMTKV